MKKILMSACALAVVLGFVACGDTKKEEVAPVAPAAVEENVTDAVEANITEENATEVNTTEAPAK